MRLVTISRWEDAERVLTEDSSQWRAVVTAIDQRGGRLSEDQTASDYHRVLGLLFDEVTDRQWGTRAHGTENPSTVVLSANCGPGGEGKGRHVLVSEGDDSLGVARGPWAWSVLTIDEWSRGRRWSPKPETGTLSDLLKAARSLVED